MERHSRYLDEKKKCEIKRPVMKSPKGCANVLTMIISLGAGISTDSFFNLLVCSNYEMNIGTFFLNREKFSFTFRFHREDGRAFPILL